MNKLMRLVSVLPGTLLALFLAQSIQAAPNHPLDALDASEITRSTALLRAKGHTDDTTPILSVALEPPEKQAVLAWQPGESLPRLARVVVRRDRINREFIIDLDADEILAIEEIPGPGQPPISFDEIFRAIDIAVGDERMQAGLAKRDITDFDAIFCAPRTGGNFGAPHEQAKRVVNAKRAKTNELPGSCPAKRRTLAKKSSGLGTPATDIIPTLRPTVSPRSVPSCTSASASSASRPRTRLKRTFLWPIKRFTREVARAPVWLATMSWTSLGACTVLPKSLSIATSTSLGKPAKPMRSRVMPAPNSVRLPGRPMRTAIDASAHSSLYGSRAFVISGSSPAEYVKTWSRRSKI